MKHIIHISILLLYILNTKPVQCMYEVAYDDKIACDTRQKAIQYAKLSCHDICASLINNREYYRQRPLLTQLIPLYQDHTIETCTLVLQTMLSTGLLCPINQDRYRNPFITYDDGDYATVLTKKINKNNNPHHGINFLWHVTKHAIKTGNISCLKHYLTIDPSLSSTAFGLSRKTLLHYLTTTLLSTTDNDVICTELFKNPDISLDKYDCYGFTPLGYAAYYNNEDMVYRLLHNGANPMALQGATKESVVDILYNKNKDLLISLCTDGLIQLTQILQDAHAPAKILRALLHKEQLTAQEIDYVSTIYNTCFSPITTTPTLENFLHDLKIHSFILPTHQTIASALLFNAATCFDTVLLEQLLQYITLLSYDSMENSIAHHLIRYIHTLDSSSIAVHTDTLRNSIVSNTITLLKILKNIGGYSALNTLNSRDYTPISLATKYGLIDIVQSLIELGISPYIEQGPYAKKHPLYLAVLNHDLSMVSLLLKHKPQTYKITYAHNDSPLHLACRHGLFCILATLLHYCDVKDVHGDHPTLLQAAIESGNPYIIRLILHNSLKDKNIFSGHNILPLHTAIFRASEAEEKIPAALELIAATPPNIMKCYWEGKNIRVTPLFIATAYEVYELLIPILEKVDLRDIFDIKNNHELFGKSITPWELAVKQSLQPKRIVNGKKVYKIQPVLYIFLNALAHALSNKKNIDNQLLQYLYLVKKSFKKLSVVDQLTLDEEIDVLTNTFTDLTVSDPMSEKKLQRAAHIQALHMSLPPTKHR